MEKRHVYFGSHNADLGESGTRNLNMNQFNDFDLEGKSQIFRNLVGMLLLLMLYFLLM